MSIKTNRKKKDRPHVSQVEPVIVDRDELVARLKGYNVTDFAANTVAEAIYGMGLRVVQMCNLCAEPQPGRIPACPNVASVVMTMTRGRSLGSGPFAVCLPHSRGEEVYAPEKPRR